MTPWQRTLETFSVLFTLHSHTQSCSRRDLCAWQLWAHWLCLWCPSHFWTFHALQRYYAIVRSRSRPCAIVQHFLTLCDQHSFFYFWSFFIHVWCGSASAMETTKCSSGGDKLSSAMCKALRRMGNCRVDYIRRRCCHTCSIPLHWHHTQPSRSPSTSIQLSQSNFSLELGRAR